MAGATTTAMPYTAKAMPRFAGGNVSARMACSLGCKPPPPAPCRMRKKTSMPEARRQSAQKTAGRKQRDARHVKALAAEARGEPRADGQHDAVRDEIAGKHPRGFVRACAETAGDVRKGDIGDGSVEHFHERGQRDREGDQPRIVPGAPRAVVDRDRVGGAHFSAVLALGLSPSSNGWYFAFGLIGYAAPLVMNASNEHNWCMARAVA